MKLRPLVLLALALPAAADVAPPSGLKHVNEKVAFTNLDAFPDYTFVLVERSGPNAPESVTIEDGLPVANLTYRWFSPVLIAVKKNQAIPSLNEPPPAEDGEPSEHLDPLAGVPHVANFSTGPGTASSSSAAETVITTYKVVGISDSAITLERVAQVALDKDGQETSLTGFSWPLLAIGGSGLLLFLAVMWNQARSTKPKG